MVKLKIFLFLLQKFICTTIRPSLLPYKELYDYHGCAEFVAEYLNFEPLDPPIDLVGAYYFIIFILFYYFHIILLFLYYFVIFILFYCFILFYYFCIILLFLYYFIQLCQSIPVLCYKGQYYVILVMNFY